MAKKANLAETGDTEHPPEPAALSLPNLSDLKDYMKKADRILDLLSKLVEMWGAVNPNQSMQRRDAPVIPNPPSNGRFHLESNDAVITWAQFP